jgi:hypothetical protein
MSVAGTLASSASLGLVRQETGEQETVRGQARQRDADNRRAGSGQAGDGYAAFARIAHQPIAGVRHQGRASVRHQRHGLFGHQRQQAFARAFVGVVVIADQALFQAQMVEQFARDPRVFASHRRHIAQNIDSAQGYVTKIANGGGNDVKPCG